MAETITLWNDRFSYSGEIPTNYPGLRPRAIARINEETSTFGGYTDGVNSSREWYMQWDASGAIWGRGNGPMGGRLQINMSGAGVEQGRLQMDHFSGLWPSSSRRRLLVGGWFWQTYEQSFNPLIDTRDTDPIIYLSTAGGTGDPRTQVYDSSGSLIFDQYESNMPWKQTTDGYFLGTFVDGFANTVQMFSVHEDGRRWLGPVRDFTGTPNWGSTADVHLYSLRHAGYYEAGYLDDVVIANPNNNFVIEDFVDDLANGTWANGYARPERDGDFTVTDDYIRSDNSSNRSFSTGARRASWAAKPSISIPSGDLLYSTDDGETWQDANGGDALPETADGILLRRDGMTLGTSSNYTGTTLTIPDAPDIEVTPEEPWQSPSTSNVAVPEQEGVKYEPTGTVTVNPGDTVTVTAEPMTGYVFPSGATTSWTYEYLYETVTPQAPTHNAEANTVSVPSQTGVSWSHSGTVDVPQVGTLVISAQPESGYLFPDGAQSSWSYEYNWPDPPTLEPIANLTVEQGADDFVFDLNYTAEVTPLTWSVESEPTLVDVILVDGQMTLSFGFETGTGTVTVALMDGRERTVEQSFNVTVEPRPWDQGPPPAYPHAPVIIYEDGEPEEFLIDPLVVTVTEEVNGPETLEVSMAANHRLAYLIYNENIVEVADERYWIRRVTIERSSGVPILMIYAERRFYELTTMGGVDPQEWNQILPGTAMETALAGTPWSIGTVNVGTRRTYELTERTNPLDVLRMVQDNHGGDLVFDNENREVNLVAQYGLDQGVAFFYGSNMTQAKRVIDTSSLVTRIHARNEDGITIASVNNGRTYLEDFTYIDEVKQTTYNFAAGTSPYTMLDMTRATLARRSKPDVSYECTVSDLSAESGLDIDRFTCHDIVTVVDHEIGIEGEQQRIVAMEYNVLRPWESSITLSARLRETGSSSGGEESLTTGSTVDTFDLVPFNLLLNARFDNGLAHWANSGVEIVETDKGTGDYAARFEGSGTRWIEQTFTPDNRDAFAFSMQFDSSGGPEGWVPNVTVEAEITYEDGDTEIVELDVGEGSL